VDDAALFGGSRADGASPDAGAAVTVPLSRIEGADPLPLRSPGTGGTTAPATGGASLLDDLAAMLGVAPDGGAAGKASSPPLAELRARSWRLTLRRRAAEALFHLLRWGSYARMAIAGGTMGPLLDVALAPVDLPGFPSAATVRYAAALTLSRCHEGAAWGGVELAAVRDAARTGDGDLGTAVAATRQHAGAVLTDAEARRWGVASSLASALARDPRLCLGVLALVGDDPDAAAGWLATRPTDAEAVSALEGSGRGGSGVGAAGDDEAVLEGVRFGAPLIDPRASIAGSAVDASVVGDDDGADDTDGAAAAAGSGEESDVIGSSVVAEALMLPPWEPAGRSGDMAGVLPPGTPVLVVTRRVADTVAGRKAGQAVQTSAAAGRLGTVVAGPMGVAAARHFVWVSLSDGDSASTVSVWRRRLVVLAGLLGRDTAGAGGAARSWTAGRAAAAVARATELAEDDADAVRLRAAGDSLVPPLVVLARCAADAERAAASHAARLAAVLLMLAWPRDVAFGPDATGGAGRLLLLAKLVIAESVSGSSGGAEEHGEGSAPSSAAAAAAGASSSSSPGAPGSAGVAGVMVAALKDRVAALVVREHAAGAARALSWVCPGCGLCNRAAVDPDATCEACSAARPPAAPAAASTSDLLIADCAAHMSDATRAMSTSSGRAGWLRTVESSHPLAAGRLEKHVVAVEGASAVFVTFSKRCCTPADDPGSSVSFFADEQCTRLVARRSGPPHAFRSFMAPCDRLYIVSRRSTASRGAAGDARSYGFRCNVRGLRGVSWSGEPDVTREPSLEWASWLLAFLVREALTPETLRTGAMHRGEMVGAMVRFLRTPDAPFKPAIFGLLASILACPQYFAEHDRPDVRLFESIGETAKRLLGSAASPAERVFPPTQLQHVLEMAASARGASVVFGTPLFCPVDVGATGASAAGAWDPASDPSAWHPALAPGVAPPDPASLDDIHALALAREVLKPVATAAQAAPGAARPARIPDPWVSMASAAATGCEVAAATGPQLVAAHRSLAQWTRRMDEDLVAWLGQTALHAEKSLATLPVASVELADRDKASFPSLGFQDTASVRTRFALLRLLNALLDRCISFVDTTGSLGPSSVGGLLRASSHVVFTETKGRLLTAAVNATQTAGSAGLSMLLDMDARSATTAEGKIHPAESRCLFVQMYEALARFDAADLRGPADHNDCLFRVTFRDQPGIDAGGLFRGALSDICDDLFTPVGQERALDLFLRSANCAADPGAEPEFVPNPARTDDRSSALFRFVGVMMGVSVRHRYCMPFDLAPLVWKLVAGDTVGLADVGTVDAAAERGLRAIQDWMPPPAAATSGSAPALRAAHSAGSYAAVVESLGELLADGAAVGEDERVEAAVERLTAEDRAFVRRFGGLVFRDTLPGGGGGVLVHDGERRLVLPSSREAFVRLVVRGRVRGFAHAVRLMRAGLACMVPARVLSVLGGQDLSTFVCGTNVVDLHVLKAHTRYGSPFTAEHKTMAYFWEVMEGLSNRERQQVIRYAWGRSRLPHGEDAWATSSGGAIRFAITHVGHGAAGPDRLLVKAHTCFFQLDVPEYTSADVMRSQLLFSVAEGLAGGYQTG